MSIRSRLFLIALATILSACSRSRRTETEAAVPPTTTTATASSDGTPDAPKNGELKAVLDRINAKIERNLSDEADYAEELETIDGLAAKYARSSPEDAASFHFLKARLYRELFEKPELALELFRKIAADFPGTRATVELPEAIQETEILVADAALTAVGREFRPFIATSTEGKVVDLTAYRGKVVLVEFWATWCGLCRDELPNLKAAYANHHDRGFEIIGVSLDTEADKLAAFTKENQMPWPQIFEGRGWKNPLVTSNGIHALPGLFLLDREGRIAAKGVHGERLQAKIAELLATKP